MSQQVSVVDASALAPVELSTEQKAKVEQIKSSIVLHDSNSVMQYGLGAQNQIAQFADTVLVEVRNKDTGFAGGILSELLTEVKDLDAGSLTRPSALAKIPILGSLFNKARKFMMRYEKVSVQVERITNELDKARLQLMRDIALLDNLYARNLEHIGELDLHISAGDAYLADFKANQLPALQQKAQASQDAMDAQKFQDIEQALHRFEKKIHDLKLSRMVAIQGAPQIRLIQNGNQALVEKIQTSILTTIPLWKNQIVIALTLFRQQKALNLQREVTDATNEMLKKNSELLKQNTIGVAKESERGIVELETLKKVNADLISTIEETIAIQSEGRTKRAAAEVELKKLESELKSKLAG